MVSPDVLAGIDTAGQQCIQARFAALQSHLAAVLPTDHPWRTAPLDPDARQALRDWFWEEKNRLVGHPPVNAAAAAYQQRLRHWQTTYLSPLVAAWELEQPVLAALLADCRKRGWFDYRASTTDPPQRPPLSLLVGAISSLLATVPFKTSRYPEQSRIVQLHQQGWCPSEEAATLVAARLDDRVRQDQAYDHAVDTLMLFCTAGAPGLLHKSGHPATTILLLVEHQRGWIMRLGASVAVVLPRLRQDVCALFQTLTWLDDQMQQWRQAVLAALPQMNRRQRSIHLHTAACYAD